MRTIQLIEQQHNRDSKVAEIIASAMHVARGDLAATASPIPAYSVSLGPRFNALLRGGVKVPFAQKRMPKSNVGLLTVAEVAARLGVIPPTVVDLIHAGKLKASNISAGKRSTWRISESDFMAFVAGGQVTPLAPKERKRLLPASRVTQYF